MRSETSIQYSTTSLRTDAQQVSWLQFSYFIVNRVWPNHCAVGQEGIHRILIGSQGTNLRRSRTLTSEAKAKSARGFERTAKYSRAASCPCDREPEGFLPGIPEGKREHAFQFLQCAFSPLHQRFE